MRRALVAVVLALGLTAVAKRAPAQSPEHATVQAVVKGFHVALERGDSVAALSFLAADVQILESGGLESRARYRGGQPPDDVAWVVGTSRTQGTDRDRQINSAGAALMVLSRTVDGLRIRAIHWSSRTVRVP